MLVYVLRHGQTICNIKRIWNGQLDAYGLTDEGYRQAINARRLLAGIQFDRVFTSDLTRATTTASIALPGYEIETDERLREFDIGSLEGVSSTYSKEIHDPDYLTNIQSNNYAPYGGEDQSMIISRIASFMQMLETLDACKSIAVVTHQGLISQMVGYVLNTHTTRGKLKAYNCSVTILEWKDKEWCLQAFNLL